MQKKMKGIWWAHTGSPRLQVLMVLGSCDQHACMHAYSTLSHAELACISHSQSRGGAQTHNSANNYEVFEGVA